LGITIESPRFSKLLNLKNMEYIREEYSTQRITGSSVTTLVTGRGMLHSINLNASSGSVLIFDGLAAGISGSAIAIVGSGVAAVPPLEFNYIVASGLTISTPAANTDITVAFSKN
jgi:hypothetical protein